MSVSRTLLAGLAACVALAFAAGAQQPDTVVIAPIVVTATRVPISIAASPATVDVITGEQLRRRGVTSLATALQSLPGVTFEQSGSYGAVTSLFLRGGESKYVKVLVDGVSVNDPGGTIDFSAITTDNVERIEVVRGPASVLYGADAVTGVIQIFTRRGIGAPKTILSARGGTYGSSDADATVLGALGSGDFSLGLARHSTSGIYAFNNSFRNTVASGGVHLVLDAATDLQVSVRYGDDVVHYPTDGGGTVVDTNAHQGLERTTLGVELGHRFTTAIDARFLLSSEGTSASTDNAPDATGGSGLQSLDRTRRRSAELRANVILPATTTLTLGAQAEQEDEQSQSVSVFGAFAPSISIFHASRRNKAAYAQTLSTLPDSVVIAAGARRDDNERFGNFTTYRVGGSWRAIGGTHLRASAGTAFREPTFFENYASGFVTGNKDLSPERSSTWEVGVRQALFADRLTLGITHFDQSFRNMIDYTGSSKSCGASYCNVARATSVGREFEARVVATRSISLDANLTHLETRVIDPGFDKTSGGLYKLNEQLIRRPTTSWNAGAAYASTIGSLDLRLVHVGDRSDRDFRPFPAIPVVVPAYTRTDLGAVLPLRRFSSALPVAELTLRVENAFDTHYQSVFNFLTPGRAVLLGARVTF
jgi:vitamin B12 transporter